jgi:hypothetical protein
MIGFEDAPHTYEYSEHFKILPAIHDWTNDPQRIGTGKRVTDDFIYSSDSNTQWMGPDELRVWIAKNHQKIGKL